MQLYVVDAFTDRPFTGNPAAVCVLEAPADERWMRRVAREMALSETAFLHPVDDGFALRWFTPTVEVELCGHATLASAHALWETNRLAPDTPARFSTQSGLLTCRKDGAWIEMDFPALVPVATPPPSALDGLGVTPRYVGFTGTQWLVAADDPAVVRAARPDFGRLAELEVGRVILTAPSDLPGYDFISRFFAPGAGVNEDPVTGSAHCVLGPYGSNSWARIASPRTRPVPAAGWWRCVWSVIACACAGRR
jgi:predicted PhzF superfamily epimerase YddE/YHI9